MGTTTQQTTIRHPYAALGIIVMIAALVLIAFDLGVLARCGGGEGVCFDVATHGTSDAALVGFFVLFFIGLILVLYTEAGSSVTRTDSPPAPPQVTVVAPAASPPPTNVTVNTSPSPPPPTTVTVNSPR